MNTFVAFIRPRKKCRKCGTQIPYDRSKHEGSSVCHIARELREIAARGLIVVSPPAPTSIGHTNRAGTIAVCKIFGLDYKLVVAKGKIHRGPWICVTPEVEETLRAVNEVAHSVMLVIPEAARRMVGRLDTLIEFDALRRLGAEHDALFDFLALAGVAGERAQFEARCTQRNPNRSDLSISRAWEKFRRRRITHAKVVAATARNLKTKP